MWLSNADFERLTSDAQILEQNLHGTKVLLRPDGRVVKLFRIKRLLSLALIYPYSLRFQRNAVRLRELGICAPEVEQLFFCPAVRRHGVVYPLLAGRTLEQLARTISWLFRLLRLWVKGKRSPQRLAPRCCLYDLHSSV